jgi:sulfoxide reductase heme-binding subunit YedZ
MGQTLWFVSRATGILSVALLTYVVVVGTVIAGRRKPHGSGSTIAMALHRWISLAMVVFLVTHILTAITDHYVSISWLAILLPFASRYRPVGIALGTLALDLMIVLLVTSFLRHRVPERAWRAIHWAAYALWPMAIIHGFVMGTTKEWVLRVITLGCGVIGLAAIGWRINARHHDQIRRAEALEQEWS